MRNYKATDSKMRCLKFQFEIGKRYSVEGPLDLCKNGFHSCNTLKEVTDFYRIVDSRFFEVEVEETIIGEGKNCSRHITVLRELSFYEVMRLLNFKEDGSPFKKDEENTNFGFFNSGNDNSGNNNQGNDNYGNNNFGNNNYGNGNQGNNNHGNGNFGNDNYGNENSGNDNSGNNNYGK